MAKQHPTKTILLGKTQEELTALALDLGMPRYAGGQISDWIYKHYVTDIDMMTNLSIRHRKALAEVAEIGRVSPSGYQESRDGTRKYLFELGPEKTPIETVFIPDGNRSTICISSQAGCKMHCQFCHTGQLGFRRHLSRAEIINQLLSLPERARITNIVFMGMGEPLDNVEEVLGAITCLTHPKGMAISPRRITVSTVGVSPGLQRLLEESSCHVAISLHTPFPEERKKWIPAESRFSLVEMTKLLTSYNFASQRRLTFEYTVFGGVNDTAQHQKALKRLLGNMHCRVNLIRYHRMPECDLPSTDEERLKAMAETLNDLGISTTIRTSRGEDISAACGMLALNKILSNA